MLSAFFVAHLFMAYTPKEMRHIAVEMLEELLNRSAKELESKIENEDEVVLDRRTYKFSMLEKFQQEFSKILMDRVQNYRSYDLHESSSNQRFAGASSSNRSPETDECKAGDTKFFK